MFSSSLVVGQL